MFVVLEHQTPTPADPATPRRVHWDFLVEVPGSERLPTWRLAANPLECSGDIPAERIGDHRRLYLEFEGEVSSGRGVVRRLTRGPATVEQISGDGLVVVLASPHLSGRFEIVPEPAGGMVFRRTGDAA